MKILEKFVRIGLFFLVLLSLFLSLNIWVSSSRKETTETKDTKISTPINERTSKDVFLPLRLIRKEENQIEMTSNENLITTIQNEIEKSSFKKLTEVVKENAEEFSKYQAMEQGIELLYEGKLSLLEYMNVYHLAFDDADKALAQLIYFTKIQVDLKNQKIRFFDYEHQNIYEAQVSINKDNIRKLLNKDETQYYPVTSQDGVYDKQFYLTNERKLKKYSYIIESQSVTRFRNAFFSDPENVRTNENSQDLTYTSGNERLTILDDNQSRLVKFDGKIKANENQNIYSETFPYIRKLGRNMGNIRYFDRYQNQINYRTFVEGFPVFSDKNKGQVQMTVSDDYLEEKSIQIETSMDTIQIPIPSDEEVTLDSTQNVLNYLMDSGASHDRINSMIIGYTWETIDETKSVVALTPEWYINYDGLWYSERQLLVKLSDPGVE